MQWISVVVWRAILQAIGHQAHGVIAQYPEHAYGAAPEADQNPLGQFRHQLLLRPQGDKAPPRLQMPSLREPPQSYWTRMHPVYFQARHENVFSNRSPAVKLDKRFWPARSVPARYRQEFPDRVIVWRAFDEACGRHCRLEPI